VTNGENDEEAAWLDLIAHYDAPADSDGGSPWPDRENLAESAPGSAQITGTSQVTQPPRAPEPPHITIPPPVTEPPRVAGPPQVPDTPQATDRPQGAGTPQDPGMPAPPQEDHYVPPPPPPLPKLDPLAKGAWAGLFGGPAFLLIATAVGWTVPAVAAFCAIAAFVGGFAILVLRMGGEPPQDSGPDDGAVV
jgi:hypothetical protein